jgi:hypothetical protein
VSIDTRLGNLLSNVGHVIIPDQGLRRVILAVVVVLVENGLCIAVGGGATSSSRGRRPAHSGGS